MLGESGIFEGEWWSPKWSTSSLPLPPDPQTQDRTIFKALEADLELGLKAPFEDPDKYNSESRFLGSYPERRWKISKDATEDKIVLNRPQVLYQFDLLRFYDLNFITHKLHHFQARLESRPAMSYETSQELTKLLQDQGTLFNPR
jgi:hypothetical protein